MEIEIYIKNGVKCYAMLIELKNTSIIKYIPCKEVDDPWVYNTSNYKKYYQDSNGQYTIEEI